MKYTTYFSIFFCLIGLNTFGQDCPDYEKLLKEGDTFKKKGEFRLALYKYSAARGCSPGKGDFIDKRIDDLLFVIEQQKNKADELRILARNSQKDAELQRDLAQARSTELKKQVGQNKALYWATESDKLIPAQAIRILEKAASFDLYLTPVYERVVKIFSDIYKRPFTQKMLNNSIAINSAHFTIDKRKIITTSSDKNLKVWDSQGLLLKKIPFDNEIHFADASPNGQYMAIAMAKKMKILDSTNNLYDDVMVDGIVTSTTFSKSGSHILVRYKDYIEKVGLYNLKNRFIINLNTSSPTYVAQFSHKNDRVITTSPNFNVTVWDLLGNPKTSLHHNEIINSGFFSMDDKYIVTSSDDKTAKFWNSEGQLLFTLKHKGFVNSAIFSNDTKFILTSSADSTAKVWDLKGKMLLSLLHDGVVNSASFSTDGSRIITASDDRTVKIWDLSGKLLTTLYHDSSVSSANFSYNDTHILTICKDSSSYLWKIDSDLLKLLDPNTSVKTQLLNNGSIVILHTEDSSAPKSDKNYIPVFSKSPIFTKNRNHALELIDDNTLKLLDINGNLLAKLQHSEPIRSASFSPNGELIITASDDKKARLWNLQGVLIKVLNHDDFVNSACFSPDGNLILTASHDKTAKIWNLQGKILANLQDLYPITSASFLNNNRILIVFFYWEF